VSNARGFRARRNAADRFRSPEIGSPAIRSPARVLPGASQVFCWVHRGRKRRPDAKAGSNSMPARRRPAAREVEGLRMAAASIHFGKAAPSSKELRKKAGTWLKAKRQEAGLSQMDLAQKLGFKYYTFISQVENGFGRVPSESMEAWGLALGLAPADSCRITTPTCTGSCLERPDDRRSVRSAPRGRPVAPR